MLTVTMRFLRSLDNISRFKLISRILNRGGNEGSKFYYLSRFTDHVCLVLKSIDIILFILKQICRLYNDEKNNDSL